MPVQLSQSQQGALMKALAGDNLLITGAAGTGKSFLLGVIIDELSRRGREVAVTASTGISALNIRGRTVHSFLGTRNCGSLHQVSAALMEKNLYVNNKTRRRLLETDVLVIDEISMLTGDYLDMADYWLQDVRNETRPFGGLQVILVGDFLQLPPVQKSSDQVDHLFAFNARVWSSLNLEICNLSECYRQTDTDFLEHLGYIRAGVVMPKTTQYFQPCVGRPLDEPTRLFPRNFDVGRFNGEKVADLPGETSVFGAGFKGDARYKDRMLQNCIADETLYLKRGAKVIILKNDPHQRYVNGSRAEVTDIDPEEVEVELESDGSTQYLKHHTWDTLDGDGKVVASVTQIPLKLAYALTIHKAQGLTLDSLHCDLSTCFEWGHAYVALSRVRSAAGLSLATPLTQGKIKAAPEALEFYSNILAISS